MPMRGLPSSEKKPERGSEFLPIRRFLTLGGFELRGVDRQSTDTLAGRSIDRVADCRRDRRHTWLADPGRRRVAVDEINIRLRRNVDPCDCVIVEIALFDLPLLRADVAVKRVADGHDRGAFEL